MHASALLAASLLGVAQAVNVHIVSVGMNPQTNETGLSYHPNKLTAAVGDMVQFHFLAGAHTITQSTFDNPCIPVGNINPATQGIFSGAMDVAASKAEGMLPIYTIQINDTKPMWLYCTTGKHCANGMAMVINENTAANSSRSLENYVLGAASFTGTSPQPGAGTGGETPATPETPGAPETPITPEIPSTPSTPDTPFPSPDGFATSALVPESSSTSSPVAPSSSVVPAAGSSLSAPFGMLAAAVSFAYLLV